MSLNDGECEGIGRKDSLGLHKVLLHTRIVVVEHHVYPNTSTPIQSNNSESQQNSVEINLK